MRTKNHNFRPCSVILVICAMLMSSMSSVAQDGDLAQSTTSSQSFNFVYIAQDETLPIQEMESTALNILHNFLKVKAKN